MFSKAGRFYKFFICLSVFLSLAVLLLTVKAFGSLPTTIPLFYAHGWGHSQLAPKALIFLPLLLQIFPPLLSFRLAKNSQDVFFSRLLLGAAMLGNTITNLAILRILDITAASEVWPSFLDYRLLLTAILAFVVSFLATPFVIKLALSLKMIDDPKHRKHPAMLQKHSIPRAGSLPIFLGFLTAVLVFVPLTKTVVGILAGGLVALVVGLWDDRADLNPYLRFLISNVLAAFLVIAAGVGIAYFKIPFFDKVVDLGAINFTVGSHNITLLADLFDMLWIIWVMNMLNWSKGVDGQFPGIVVIAAIVIGLLSLRLAPADPTQFTLAQIAFATAGATLAFLVFNWHPSRILPGYGTTFLGLILATLAIYSGAKVAVAVLVLLVPTLDAVAAIMRRVLRGQSPFWHDREHLHHRLLNRGWSHQRIAYFYWGVTAFCGLTALLTAGSDRLLAFLVIGGLAAFSIAVLNLRGVRNYQ
ncbi:MAG: MraY family glycosyltransferase [bacterium]